MPVGNYKQARAIALAKMNAKMNFDKANVRSQKCKSLYFLQKDPCTGNLILKCSECGRFIGLLDPEEDKKKYPPYFNNNMVLKSIHCDCK
jgi:hypothetical protein